jgi:hypothetical protein
MVTKLEQGYLTPLVVMNINAKDWRIYSRFGWRGSKGDEFWVEPGDITDFASVPWWTQAILPRTGTWTKAAVLHDKMCDIQNSYHRLLNLHAEFRAMGYSVDRLEVPLEPIFNSIDTDAIFRKNARAEGTDRVRAELLWFGVRTGALRNPARRGGWWRTMPRYFLDLFVILLPFLLVAGFLLW